MVFVLQTEQEGSQDNDADEEADSPHTIARHFHDGLHPPGISKRSPMNIAQKRPSPGRQAVCSRYGGANLPVKCKCGIIEWGVQPMRMSAL